MSTSPRRYTSFPRFLTLWLTLKVSQHFHSPLDKSHETLHDVFILQNCPMSPWHVSFAVRSQRQALPYVTNLREWAHQALEFLTWEWASKVRGSAAGGHLGRVPGRPRFASELVWTLSLYANPGTRAWREGRSSKWSARGVRRRARAGPRLAPLVSPK